MVTNATEADSTENGATNDDPIKNVKSIENGILSMILPPMDKSIGVALNNGQYETGVSTIAHDVLGDDSNESVVQDIGTASSPIQSIDVVMNAECTVFNDVMNDAILACHYNIGKIIETLQSSMKEQIGSVRVAARRHVFCLEQSLDDENKKSIEDEQSITELRANLVKIDKANQIIEESKRENDQLKQENGKLKQERGKRVCNWCGKVQEFIQHCNNECLQKYK